MKPAVLGSFADIVEVDFVKFDKGEVRLRFTSSEFLVGENRFNNRTYTFCVVEGKEDKMLNITSIRLMLHLKEFDPLEGKVLTIERTGEGMETDYIVKEIA